MGRRRRENTLNLFAFQDIITGVAGVMMFILLLLVVQMTLRAATASTELAELKPDATPAEPMADEAEKLRQMQRELEALRQRGAELLRADGGDLNAKIEKAKAELEELMGDAAEQKSQAEAIFSQMSSKETNTQKASTLDQRNALRRRLEQLEEEEIQHAGGKLVAFKAASSGVRELWIVDMRATRATIFNVESPRDSVAVTYERFELTAKIVQSIRSRLQELTKVRNVVVLMRPSIAGPGSEMLDAFRRAGLNVALELLDEDTRVAPPSQEVAP
jgi:hypothetical protein